MTVLDLLNGAWAITPVKLDAMREVYERHAAQGQLDPAAFMAAQGIDPKNSQGLTYTVEDGVAIIPVEGVLAKKMNIFSQISGGMSTQMLVQVVNDAINDPAVHSLMLSIDSPGGEVDGTQQIAAAVAASPKPTAAWIDGEGCSAAMWIASQCDSVYAASDTTTVGAIAVVMTHNDRSKANETRGVKPTHITTGKYKRILSGDAPLSQDGLAYAQNKLDYLHTLFVNAVADGRGTTPEDVDTNMADGQTFFAQQAVKIGLIDGIASEEQVIASLVAAYQSSLQNPGASHSGRTPNPTQGAVMSYKTFATQAEYEAEIRAAEARGVASTVDPDVLKAQESMRYAAQLRSHVAKAKSEGRIISLAEADAELQRGY